MDTSLVGKTAIVCGSTQGIGKAAAVELADLGANVVLLARNEEALRRLSANCPPIKGKRTVSWWPISSMPRTCVTALPSSLGSAIPPKFSSTIPEAPRWHGDRASVDEFVQGFNNHLLCNHHLVQALVPGMKAASYGRIVNVISTSVKQPIPGLVCRIRFAERSRVGPKRWPPSWDRLASPSTTCLPGFTSTADWLR